MTRSVDRLLCCIGGGMLVAACALVGTLAAAPVTLAENGRPLLPIVAGSSDVAVAEVKAHLDRITGGQFQVEQRPADAPRNKPGIFVGKPADFSASSLDPKLVKELEQLGPQGIVVVCREGGIFCLGNTDEGVAHAAVTLLRELGCRWFFPGEVWSVIPDRPTLRVDVNLRQRPAFPDQRRIWYGYGMYPQNRTDYEAWCRRNRQGGALHVSIGHTGYGLDFERDFAAHPEWFALVDGRRQPTKPCFSHPAVLQRAIETARKQAAAGAAMISLSPPDGLGYCECPRCRQVFGGAEPQAAHGTLFATRADGVLVNITSENLFRFVNRVAEALAEDYPDVLLGCYAYSAYSHPPSFVLHKNVYLQTTTSYRRTPLSLEEQLAQFGERTARLGIREYFSVYQWDWDDADPGRLRPAAMVRDLRFYHRCGVTAINAEASNNWGPRGLGYYVAAQGMWDPHLDVPAIVEEFLELAFGPAAEPMRRYYQRWYGDLSLRPDDLAAETQPSKAPPPSRSREALAAAFADLDEAARRTADSPACRARVDQLRMYWHFLWLRHQLHEAHRRQDREAIRAGVRAETVFGGRLADTNLVHARPLLGKAFPRRFRLQMDALEGVSEVELATWRQLGQPPTAEELQALWEADRRQLAE